MSDEKTGKIARIKSTGSKVGRLGKKVVGARPDGSISGTKVTGTVAMGLGSVGLARALWQGNIIEIVLAAFTILIGAVLRFFNPIDRDETEEGHTEAHLATSGDAEAAAADLSFGNIVYDTGFVACMRQGHLELGYPEDQFNILVSKFNNKKLKGADKKHWDILSRWAKKSLVETS